MAIFMLIMFTLYDLNFFFSFVKALFLLFKFWQQILFLIALVDKLASIYKCLSPVFYDGTIKANKLVTSFLS